MKKNYKTYTKEKWLFFALSIAFYFVPFVTTAACLLPVIAESAGTKWAIGMVIILINTIPFLMGIYRAFFAHFPMFNILAIVFLGLAAFFSMDIFQYYVEIFVWIELAAGLGSIASCICWHYHRKFGGWQQSIKANVKSGAFVMRTENTLDKTDNS